MLKHPVPSAAPSAPLVSGPGSFPSWARATHGHCEQAGRCAPLGQAPVGRCMQRLDLLLPTVQQSLGPKSCMPAGVWRTRTCPVGASLRRAGDCGGQPEHTEWCGAHLARRHRGRTAAGALSGHAGPRRLMPARAAAGQLRHGFEAALRLGRLGQMSARAALYGRSIVLCGTLQAAWFWPCRSRLL
jgi:hypothetical protein